MRGAGGHNESLSSTVKLDDFVPANHPLLPIRLWINDALSKMDSRFSAMYEADIKGGRPSIAPEKLMRSMLLQVLYSIRSARQLVEQISCNLPFGLSIEDAVWNHSVFSKNRGRLIEHDVATEQFNATVEMGRSRGLLSCERFSLDGTLLQTWASHKSVPRKDGSDDGLPPNNRHGGPRSNETQASRTAPQAKLYRKGDAAPALPSYMGHVKTDNRHGLVVNIEANRADGYAERLVAAQMTSDAARAAIPLEHRSGVPSGSTSKPVSLTLSQASGTEPSLRSSPRSDPSSSPPSCNFPDGGTPWGTNFRPPAEKTKRRQRFRQLFESLRGS
ncbi:putative transposase [Rubrivivax gelatinosus IL144]|uniref:Putative transposase n=1 Tax=Rubrivivax gelatinosus (strain NBRC 100245 / IL144) TaxID=983917 RepID=I0HTI8_RUBGI|nr:putative transposase [Rubrivivax gelatinosus IL144]